MTEDEVVGGHHQLHGHDVEQTLGDSEGQESLACYSPWGFKELDRTKRQNNSNKAHPYREGERGRASESWGESIVSPPKNWGNSWK